MEKKILTDGYSKKPASIPRSIYKKFRVKSETFQGRTIWELARKNERPDQVILFLHGGAFFANITLQHWLFAEQLLHKANINIVIPDYPLAPDATYQDIYRFVDTIYADLIANYPTKKIVLLGDSAGSNLALGLAQRLRDARMRQPDEIILLSPWLDVSMSNPDIANFERSDRILSVNGLRVAGEKYAGNLDTKDCRVSPIFGELSNLGRVSVFIGTNDILVADARRFKRLLEYQPLPFNYFEYPGMFHDWVIITTMQESKDLISRIATLLLPE